jgi:hypothetical protein
MIIVTVKQQRHIKKLMEKISNKNPNLYIAIDFEHRIYGTGDGIESKLTFYSGKVLRHKYFDTAEELIKHMEDFSK